MTGPNEARERSELRKVIRTVRGRWRSRLLLRGALWTGASLLAALVAVRLGLIGGRIESPAVAAGLAALLYLGVAVVALRTLVVPLLRRVSDRQVALYLEEHEPRLQAEILTAVEATEESGDGGIDPILAELVRSAALRAREVEGGRRVDREPLRRLSAAAAGAGLVVAIVLFVDLFGFRTSLPEAARPWTAVQAAPPMAVLIVPGDTTVPLGAELHFAARLRGFDSDRVELAFRPAGSTSWERWPMAPAEESEAQGASPGASAREHRFVLFRVEEPLEFFVESEGIRSGIHRVDVVELPYVSRLELEIRPPAYTGRPAELVEDGADLAVLPGTRVQVRAATTVAVPRGRVVLEGAEAVELLPGEDGRLEGTFTVDREGFYRIELEDEGGGVHRGSPDHRIDLLENLPPVVSFARPGRDVRATSIEEVFLEVRAADDHGIASLELLYSVNGGDEVRVPLLEGEGRRLAEVSAAHTFFLEDYELEPGDLVAYHARARDVGPGAAEREARTDLYFIQVEPFDREFRQADDDGGAGMQGDGQVDGDGAGQLSRRQRDVVTATFNVQRDRRAYTPEGLGEAIATIALAQGRLRDEVETLIERFRVRGVQADPEMRRVAEVLPAAVEAMEEALEALEEGSPEEALPPEQRALQHLLRAEATFREIQVGWSPDQDGGGGGEGDRGDDLADYFDLEMDRMRNQYEALQRGEREERDRVLDETQERLRELARRQQQEQERLRRRQEQRPPGAANQGGDSQRRLAEETEELARQLERLSREQSSPEMAETAQRLRQAAESMRRSAASRDERGIGQAEEAAEALEEARRLLDRSRGEQMEREARAVEDRMRRALERQERIRSAVEDLPEDVRERREAARGVQEQKEDLRQEVDGLQQDLRRLAREAAGEDREAARGFQEAADAIRDGRIADRIEFSGAMAGAMTPEQARQFEEEITERMRDAAERLSRATSALGEREGDRARELVDRTRDLLRGAESMAERARRAEEAAAEAGERGEPGAPGDAETRRQLRREAEERAREAEALGRALREAGFDGEAMDRIASSFGSLTSDAPYGDPVGLARLQQEVVESLREMDFLLRRQLAGDPRAAGEAVGTGEVPEGYRALVEEYFRSLARPPR
jgi:hypothetical protein